MRILVPLAVALSLCTVAVRAQNWPHWRGPSASGVSPETGLPSEQYLQPASFQAPRSIRFMVQYDF